MLIPTESLVFPELSVKSSKTFVTFGSGESVYPRSTLVISETTKGRSYLGLNKRLNFGSAPTPTFALKNATTVGRATWRWREPLVSVVNEVKSRVWPIHPNESDMCHCELKKL